MRVKFLLLGPLVAAITIFVWGAFSHLALPWHITTLKEFQNNQTVLDAGRANTSGNGIYFSPEGIFAVVALLPDLSDKTQDIGGNMAVQFVTDLIVALLLAIVLLSVRSTTVLGRATVTARVGLAAGIAIHVAHWNWYGFSPAYTMVNLLDVAIGWFLAGLVLGALMKKMQVVT